MAGPEDEGNVTDVVMLSYRRHAMVVLEVPAYTKKDKSTSQFGGDILEDGLTN